MDKNFLTSNRHKGSQENIEESKGGKNKSINSSNVVDESDLERAEIDVADVELEHRSEASQAQADIEPGLARPPDYTPMKKGDEGSALKHADEKGDIDYMDPYSPKHVIKTTGGKPSLKYLKYGDKIKISIHKEGKKLYLYSDGFATRRVYLQGSTGSSSVSEVFKVIPRAEHEQLTRLRQDLAELLDTSKKANIKPGSDAGYAKLIKEEIQLTLNRAKELMGKPIHYRDSIQLIHEETQQYVAVSKNVELSEKAFSEGVQLEGELSMLLKSGVKKDIMRAYSLKLQHHTSATTHFMLVPCHNYQESGYILEDDNFYFAYADSKLLQKNYHLYFPITGSELAQPKAFNVYLYEAVKSVVKYEIINEEPFRNHLFANINRKAVWITHIEAPLFLCLDKIEKTTETEENEMGELIKPVGDALSHNFFLGFVRYDESEGMLSPKGMWIVTASPDDPKKVILKHLLYDVWLKPLYAENVVRGESQKGAVSDGAVIKLKLPGRKKFIAVNQTILSSATKAMTGTAISSALADTSDYPSCFKIVLAKQLEQLQNYSLSHLTMFIRSYDEQNLRKTYDFTAKATFEMLSGTLKSMEQLCLNMQPISYEASLPFQVPNQAIQRVFYYAF